MESKTKKSFFKRFWWIFFIIIIIIGAIFGANELWQNKKYNESRYAKFITSSPIDLSQIRSLSKLRSCAGHDYSGENIDGEIEINRSMKHYAVPLDKYNGTKNEVKIFAPWDGKIAKIEGPSKAESTGSSIYFQKDGWWFEFGHVEPLPGLKVGQKVESGQHIGYVEPIDGSAFDLQFYHSGKHVDWLKGIDSYFNHATSEIVTEYAAYGLMPENLIISKEFRDQNPCQGFNQNPETDHVMVKH